MRVTSIKPLRDFWQVHPDSEMPLRNWYKRADLAAWQSIIDTRKDFASADTVGMLTVFNVAGNKYRLIVRIFYPSLRIYARRVLTHAEYDRGDWQHDPFNA